MPDGFNGQPDLTPLPAGAYNPDGSYSTSTDTAPSTEPTAPSTLPTGDDTDSVKARALAVYNGMRDRGHDIPLSLGFAANATVESKAKSSAVNSDSGAAGMFQWLGSRADAYRALHGQNPNEGDFDENLDHADWESKTIEADSVARAAKEGGYDPVETAAALRTHWERAGLTPEQTAAEAEKARKAASWLLPSAMAAERDRGAKPAPTDDVPVMSFEDAQKAQQAEPPVMSFEDAQKLQGPRRLPSGQTELTPEGEAAVDKVMRDTFGNRAKAPDQAQSPPSSAAPDPNAAPDGAAPQQMDTWKWGLRPTGGMDTLQTPSVPKPTTAQGYLSEAAQFIPATGQMIAGHGEALQHNEQVAAQKMLDVMDRSDKGDQSAIAEDPYAGASEEQRNKIRSQIQDYLATPQTPNAITRFGNVIEQKGNEAFPLPESPSLGQRVVGGISGMVPMVGAGAIGGALAGPEGAAIATLPVVGGQTYHATLAEAKAKGLPDDQAHEAAGVAALTQMGIMALPVGRLVEATPSLAPGLTNALLDVAKRGGEFAGFNTLAKVADNWVAQNYFDPNRSLGEGVPEAVLEGAVTGGAFGAPHALREGATAAADRVAQGGRYAPAFSDFLANGPGDSAASPEGVGQAFREQRERETAAREAYMAGKGDPNAPLQLSGPPPEEPLRAPQQQRTARGFAPMPETAGPPVDEFKTPEQAAEEEEHPVPPTTPEPKADIEAQIAAVADKDNPKDAAFVAKGTAVPPLPPGVYRSTRDEGTLVSTDPAKLQAFQDGPLTDEKLAGVLGYPETKSEAMASGNPVVVEGKNEEGQVVASALASTEKVPETAATIGAQASQVEVKTPDEAQADRKQQVEDEQTEALADPKKPTDQPPMSGAYVMVQPQNLTVDPERFQYKQSGEGGVTGALHGVQKWEPALANPITAWQGEDGKLYVVNGHQRTDLALRAQSAGQQDVRMPARVYREADGYTPEYMRTLGAYQNMAEGSGTAIDAAKVLRGRSSIPPELQLPDLPPKGAIVAQARSLEGLSDHAFGMVENGLVPPAYAAHVGDLIKDPTEQMAALDMLAKAQPANSEQARLMVKDIRDSGYLKGDQTTLFGDEAFAKSLIPERARILDNAMRNLRRTKTVFKAAVEGEEALTSAGNTLDRDANTQARSENERLLDYLQRDATKKGEVSDALNVLAAQVADGKLPIAGAASRLLFKARDFVRRGQSEGVQSGHPTDGEERPGDEGPLLGLAEDTIPLFSPVERAADGLKQEKGTGPQMLAQIEKTPGVKGEEIKSTGLGDWLKGQKTVNKKAIQDFVRSNKTDVHEVLRGGHDAERDQVAKDVAALGLDFAVTSINSIERAGGSPDLVDRFSRYVLGDSRSPPPRYESYTLPGGKNYRELLLTLPQKSSESGDSIAQRMFGKPFRELSGSQKAEAQNEANRQDRQAIYRSSHWDEPNVLAHIRFDERTAPDGKKTLMVQEIQSDWHQAGRRRGYLMSDAEHGALYDREQELIAKGRNATPAEKQEWADIQNRFQANSSSVPDAPFKTSWPALSMRRVIKWAVDHGFDRVAWSPGQVHADRYDLSKQINALHYTKTADGQYLLAPEAHNGREVPVNNGLPVPEEKLADYVGKEIALKIAKGEGEGEGDTKTLSGLDLKVGGEGMKGFYDKILPAATQKIIGKYGARVGRSEVNVTTAATHNPSGWESTENHSPQEQNSTQPVHSFDITPEMKAKVKSEGLPLHEPQDLFGNDLPQKRTRAEVPKYNTDKRQMDLLDTGPSALQMQAKRDQEGRGALLPKGPQKSADEGLFARPEPEQPSLLDQKPEVSTKSALPLSGTNVDLLSPSGRKEHAPDLTKEAHEESRAWTLENGKSGNEYLTAVSDGKIIHAVTSDAKNFVDIDPNGFKDLPPDSLVIHHNHPGNGSFSESDIAMAFVPQVRAIVAHAGDDVFIARANPLYRQGSNAGYLQKWATGQVRLAATRVRMIMQSMINRDEVPIAMANHHFWDLVSRALHARGIIDYTSTCEVPEALQPVLQRLPNAANADRRGGSALTVRPDEAIAGLRQGDGSQPPGRAVIQRVPPDGEGGTPPPRQDQTPVGTQGRLLQPGLGLNLPSEGDVIKDKSGPARAAAEIKAWLSPTSLKNAKPVERQLRQHGAEQAQSYAQAAHHLEQARFAVDKLSKDEQLAFIDRMERGQPQPTPELTAVSQALRQTLDQWTKKIQSLGQGYLRNAIDDYMGHIYGNYREWAAGQENPTQAEMDSRRASAMQAKKPLTGSGSFLKQRSFRYLKDAVDAGLEPITYNPVDMQLMKIREMQKFYHGTRLADQMKQTDIARWIRKADEGAAAQAGLVKLDDRVFQPRIVAEQGLVEPGNYYATEAQARIFNNYMSQGLAGHSLIYDTFRKAGNVLNNLQLSLSGFHAAFVTLDTAMSSSALGLHQIMGGRIGEGSKNIALGSIPGLNLYSVVRAARMGGKLKSAWLDPEHATPEWAALAQRLNEGGGRVSMDQFYRNSDAGTFFHKLSDLKHPASPLYAAAQSWRDHPDWQSRVMLPLRLVGRTMDTLMHPLMGSLVPRAKLGTFALMAQDWQTDHPDATPEERSAQMIKIWDSVENRLGQMTYDNVFWKKAQKDIAFITVRSVGWNLGTVRELGGGLVDTGAAANDLAHMRKPEFTYRMSYSVMLAINTAILGGIMTYLLTGEAPQSPMDYFYPRTGNTDDKGVPERLSIPGYAKDVVAFSHAPGQTVLNKLHPAISVMSQLYQNKDYYGGVIYDPEVDNPAAAYADYLLNQHMPFAIRAMTKMKSDGLPPMEQALGFWGFQPAPKSITQPEAEAKFIHRENRLGLRRRGRETGMLHIFTPSPGDDVNADKTSP